MTSDHDSPFELGALAVERMAPGVWTMARDLHVTSPMLTGNDVRDVQRQLLALGYAPGVADGVYGQATAGAVRAFQADRKLEVDGVVGPNTRAALAMPAPRTPPVTPPATPPVSPGPWQPAPSTRGQRALAEALKHLGVKEDPPGSNRTPFGAWFGLDGAMWCNIFVSYCFSVGAGYTIAQGFGTPAIGVYPKGCSLVATTEDWLRASGFWLGRVDPQPGDIAIYDFDGSGAHHTGIVERSLGNGRFSAIEGNTGSSSDSNGGEVKRCDRKLTDVHGFGRIPG